MLPSFQSNDPSLGRLQNAWASALNPIVDLPLLKGVQLKNVELTTGANIINHRLGRAPQGYILTRTQDAATTLYDTQSTNPRPELTLQLNSSATCRVDLWIY